MLLFALDSNSYGYPAVDSLTVMKAGCEASSYIDRYNKLPDSEGSPVNIARCFSRGSELILKGVSGKDLVEKMCEVVIFSWPKDDGVWKQSCFMAGYKALIP